MLKLAAAALAACMASATAPVMAQGVEQANRNWTGTALLYNPSRVTGCDVRLVHAETRTGHVILMLRHDGTRPVQITLSGRLAGSRQSAMGTGTARMAPGQTVTMALMRTYAGSLLDSVLTVNGVACSFTG